MNILKGILSESKEHYLDAKQKIERRLLSLPQGSVKERRIAGKKYYYLQSRAGKKIVHQYLGKDKPESLIKQLVQVKFLKAELKKVSEALRMLNRAEGRKRG